MAKSAEKMKALALRREGESIKDIAKQLGVSAGSVGVWCRDIELSPAQTENLLTRQIEAGHKGRMIGANANREKRLAKLALAKTEAVSAIPDFSKDALFYTGLGLYWGEGVKSGTGSLAVVNSDPRVITLMARWFTECLGVDGSRFMPRVFVSDTHRDREDVITDFWVQKLAIPRSQFRRMIFLDKGKKIYENRDSYYGVLALRIAKGGDIRHRILASIDRIAELSSLSA
jgi:transposase-like protein